MDPDASKIQLLGRIVQLYKKMDKLAPNTLIEEWNLFIADLQKETGSWDNAFQKTNMNPTIADKMRIEISENVNMLQEQRKPTPQQKVMQKPTISIPQEKTAPPQDDLLGMMFSETMKKVKKTPDVTITQEMLKEFKVPELPPLKTDVPKSSPEKPKVGPEVSTPEPTKPKVESEFSLSTLSKSMPKDNKDISGDLQNLDAMLSSPKITTKDVTTPPPQMDIMPPESKKPTTMKIEHEPQTEKKPIVVESQDQQHLILSNLNNTIDKYWADITDASLSRGIPKSILTKFDWIYEKNQNGDLILTTDSFGEVTLEEKAYAKEVAEIVERFVKEESEFSLIKKMATHDSKSPPPEIKETIQQKATQTISKLEDMTAPKKDVKPKTDPALFSNVMNVMDEVYTTNKKADNAVSKKDMEFLEQIGLSTSHLTTLSSSLFELAQKEMDTGVFNFKSPADPKAKQFAKWIYDKIPSLIGKPIDDRNRKKLATRLFIQILNIIR